MEHRKFHISTTGDMIDILNDNRIDSMIENVTPDMKNGDYYQAVKLILDEASNYVSQGVAPNSHRIQTDNSGKFTIITIVIAAMAGIGTSIFFYIYISRKYLLKKSSYHYPFYELSTLNLTESRTSKTLDITTTRHIPKPPPSSGSSTHMGSSGTSHGGGSGSF